MKLAMLQDNESPALFEMVVTPREKLWELAVKNAHAELETEAEAKVEVNPAEGKRNMVTAGSSRYSVSGDMLLAVLKDGKDRTFRYNDPKGNRREVVISRGSRRFGAEKIARKHIADFGTATAGGFTLEEMDKYLDDVFAKGKKSFDKKTSRRTFEITTPGNVTFYVGTFISGGREYVNTIHTDRTQKETKRLGTHFGGQKASSVNQANKSIASARGNVNPSRMLIPIFSG